VPAQRLASAVYDQLKQGIVSGEYPPETWLSVEALCQDFQVSRQPVMEAMRRLSGEWLVEIVPQVGCRVASYPEPALRDFMAIFGEMEGALGALAAERRTDEEFQALEEHYDRLKKLKSHDDDYRALERQLHQMILDMAHSEVMARVCSQMWDFGEFVFTTLGGARLAGHVDQTLATQSHLVAAIKMQNASLARMHMVMWLTSVLVGVL
jgi:DNA-binding GntR family transcriptional regulator